jgi:hypothetical protein
MRRQCLTCGRPLAASDLAREQSRHMEADRKAAGLAGVRFLCYRCPCGTDDVFVDVLPRDGELVDDFNSRVGQMREAVGRLPAPGVAAQVVPVPARGE